jgi:hypothetical protein
MLCFVPLWWCEEVLVRVSCSCILFVYLVRVSRTDNTTGPSFADHDLAVVRLFRVVERDHTTVQIHGHNTAVPPENVFSKSSPKKYHPRNIIREKSSERNHPREMHRCRIQSRMVPLSAKIKRNNRRDACCEYTSAHKRILSLLSWVPSCTTNGITMHQTSRSPKMIPK